MKINTIKHIWLLILIIMATSCSNFLDEESKKNVNEEDVYANLDLIESTISGIYSKWNNARADETGLILMMGTDEVQQGAYQVIKEDFIRGGLDRFDSNLNPDNTYVTAQWNSRWPMINEAAKVIKGLESYEVLAGTKPTQLLGEASFLRAFFNFEMTMYWGKIPI